MNGTTDRKIADIIRDNAEMIAKSLEKGRDIEIRKTKTGISVTEVKKTVIAR